jgi:hypothetical protein
MQSIGNIMAGVNGSSFIGIDTITDVKLRGGMKNPQQGRVQKRMTGASVMVFQNNKSNAYENMVHRRLVQEGKNPTSFQLSPRTWGERIPNSPFIRHEKNGVVKYYLEVIFLKAGTVEYLLDGNVVDKSVIDGLQENDPNPDGQGGLDNKVIIRTYAIDSLTKLRVDKQEHIGPFYC